VVVDTVDIDDKKALMHLSLSVTMAMLEDSRLAEIIKRGVEVYNMEKEY